MPTYLKNARAQYSSSIEHVPPSAQCASASISQIEDLITRKLVGYRAYLSTGLVRDFKTYQHALAWCRFMLDLPAPNKH